MANRARVARGDAGVRGRASSGAATTYSWKTDANGNWNVAANWTVVTGPPGLGYPNIVSDIAIVPDVLTANRTITIPNGVTILVGSLQITEGNGVVIQAAGTGRPIFASMFGDVFMTVSGGGFHGIAAPIRLDDHLHITLSGPGANITFNNGISQGLGPPHDITMSGEGVLAFDSDVANTFGGFFNVNSGQVRLMNGGGAVAIPNMLTIGDHNGAPESARVRLQSIYNNIADTVDVIVYGDGAFEMANFSETIHGLSIFDGLVDFGSGPVATLTTTTFSMEGGTLDMGSTTSSQLSFTAATASLSSSPAETAVIALALGNVGKTAAWRCSRIPTRLVAARS